MKNYMGVFLLLAACSNEKQEVINIESEKVEFPVLDPDSYNVAFLIMDGTFNTELTAPYDIFHHTKFRDSIKAMNVFTVANTRALITTFEGLKIKPDYDYLVDELPAIDILVVPSAEHHLDTDLKDTAMLSFVKIIDESAMYIISHCDGAFVLAEAGVLNNSVSTTYPGDLSEYKKRYSNLEVIDSVLFVHDGKYITSAGGARSFEASLYLCEMMYGKKIADEIAEGMVIEWNLENTRYLTVAE